MLDKASYKILKNLYKQNNLTLRDVGEIDNDGKKVNPPKEIRSLNTAGFISATTDEKDCSHKTGYEITPSGRAYVEQHRRNTWNFWIPYLITTLIALASLIISFQGHTTVCCCCVS